MISIGPFSEFNKTDSSADILNVTPSISRPSSFIPNISFVFILPSTIDPFRYKDGVTNCSPPSVDVVNSTALSVLSDSLFNSTLNELD